MKRPAVLVERPSVLLLSLGGAVATLLLSAMIFLAPTFGFPLIPFPHLIGGVFTGDPGAAGWLGFWIFFLVGWLVFPLPLFLLWPMMPGDNVRFGGAVVKGALWGLALWLLSGLLLPVFGWLNQLRAQGLENPGLFALGEGALGAVGLLLGHLAYGVALTLVAAMGQGLAPLDVLGWMGYERSALNRAAGSGNR